MNQAPPQEFDEGPIPIRGGSRLSAARPLWPQGLFGATLIAVPLIMGALVIFGVDDIAPAYFVITAFIMGASAAISAYYSRDILCLANAVPLAYFLFLLPNCVMLLVTREGGESVAFMVGYRRVLVDWDSVTTAFRLICFGATAYLLGLLFCLSRLGDKRSHSTADRTQIAQIDLGRCALIALAAFAAYCVMSAAVAGSVGEMLRFISSPEMRDRLSEVWYRNTPGMLMLVLLVAVTFAFAKLAVLKPDGRMLLCGFGFAVAFVGALPYGNREFVLTCLVYPVFMWHYLKRRIRIAALILGLLILPYFAEFFLTLRQGTPALPIVLDRAWIAFANESNMVSVFSTVIAHFRSGSIGYEYGRDVLLIFSWFVPRGLWPEKAWPLDYRLALTLGFADPNRPSGSPVTAFGGFWLNFTVYGMIAALALLGYLTMRLHHRLGTSTVQTIFWRAVIFFFLIDLTRVGDIVREFWTAAVQVLGFFAVAQLLRLGRTHNTVEPLLNGQND
jgi:hypothetical protein